MIHQFQSAKESLGCLRRERTSSLDSLLPTETDPESGLRSSPGILRRPPTPNRFGLVEDFYFVLRNFSVNDLNDLRPLLTFRTIRVNSLIRTMPSCIFHSIRMLKPKRMVISAVSQKIFAKSRPIWATLLHRILGTLYAVKNFQAVKCRNDFNVFSRRHSASPFVVRWLPHLPS